MYNGRFFLACLGTGLIVIVPGLIAQSPPSKIDAQFFSRKIAPILKTHCLGCHNPDKSRGGLDLSSRSALLEGGDKGPAIHPGNATGSLLHKMVSGAKPKMPRGQPPLAAEEVADLGRWIDGGAPWPEQLSLVDKDKKPGETWWSFQPLQQPPLPEVKDKDWCRTPIDRFILAGLEKEGMKPSAEADRLTLIRRVTYDLHGLPPTPDEIDQFLKDPSPEAFEKLVDRLLASPRYGERWARIWLDLVHYADTHGYDKDKRRLFAWLYRDWVIRAMNADMPYRRFVKHQVAGDMLFPNDPDGIIATGFVTAGPWDFVGQVELREGTVDKDKTRNLDRDDMVANTLSTFNSLTVHCARCHDHKFDPISQKEYYQLQAVFAGVERGDRPVQTPDLLARHKELDGKRRVLEARRQEFLRKALGKKTPELEKLDLAIAQGRRELMDLPPPKTKSSSPSNGFHSAIFPKADATAWVQVDLGQAVQIDMVALYPARPVDFPDAPGFGFPTRFKLESSDDPTFATATLVADHTTLDFPNPGDEAVVIPLGKKARYLRLTAQRLWKRSGDYVFALAELEAIAGGKNWAKGAIVTASDSIEIGLWSKRFLVDQFTSRRQLPDPADPQVIQRMQVAGRIFQAQTRRQHLADALLEAAARAELADLDAQLAQVGKQLNQLKDSGKAYAVLPIPPRPIHLLARGDVERKGELVRPGSLRLLPGLDHHFAKVKDNDEGARRAALAHWLADDINVLTWRSVVNRLWQFHFGKGLVDTPNDFGRNGNRPSHPDLLDWLAADFRDHDSMKRLHRMMVLSSAYRQSSAHDGANAKKDGDNRLLWRMNRQRLDAESVRDTVLSVSGKLEADKMYGPGFDLFAFKDDHSPIYDHLDLKRINAPDTWRRTIYRFAVRSVPNPFLESLDCADPNINVPVRNTTLTALQALAMLNNPFMVEQADFFAQRLRSTTKDPALQINLAFRLAFGRPPSADENQAVTTYAARHGLANACRLLLNANEFLFVD